MRPLKPVVMPMARLAVASVLWVKAGASTGRPLRTVTGLVTTWLPSLQRSLPYCQTLSGAPARVSATVNGRVWPGASVRLAGVTTAV